VKASTETLLRWMKDPRSIAVCGFLALVGFVVIWVALTFWRAWQAEARYSQMREIVFALHAYHDEWDRFPPPTVVDSDTGAVRSWRTLLREHFRGSAGRQSSELEGANTEPWSPESDLSLEDSKRFSLHSRGRKNRSSQVLAIRSGNGIWGGTGCGNRELFRGRFARTPFLIMIPSSNVKWWEPRDVELVNGELFLQGRHGSRRRLDIRGKKLIWISGFTTTVGTPEADTEFWRAVLLSASKPPAKEDSE